MTKTTQTDLTLKKANAKFTRAKAAVDGTPGKEKAYQKAKRELVAARRAAKEQRYRDLPGDATATPEPLTVQATPTS